MNTEDSLEELIQKQAKMYQQGFRFRVVKLQDLSQRLSTMTDNVNLLVEAIINNDLPKAKQLLYRFITFT